jgi:hypothetical protein
MLVSHKFPSRTSEAVWCSKHVNLCDNGHGFDPFVLNVPVSSLKVQHSGVGDRAGRGVFARQEVPAGSSIGMEVCVHGMFLSQPTYELVTSMHLPTGDKGIIKYDGLWKSFREYVYGYGWESNIYVRNALSTPTALILVHAFNDSLTVILVSPSCCFCRSFTGRN